MRFVEEAERERALEGGEGEIGLDLEEGLLGEVDELLQGQDEGDVEEELEESSKRIGKEGKLVDVLEEEGDEDPWGQGDGAEFSDFDEEERGGRRSLDERLSKAEGELVSLGNEDLEAGTGGMGGPRRDSDAWGFDLDEEDGHEEPVAPPVKKRID